MSCEYRNREDLIIKHLPLVRRVVSKIETRNQEHDFDDLVSMGVIGLMDAIEKYDYKRKVPFEAYATLRIRGNIMDELRRSGKVSRYRMEKLNEYYSAKEDLERKLLRTPKEFEICEELGIDDQELSKLHETVHYLANVSLESVIFSNEGSDTQLIDMIQDDQGITPEESIVKDQEREILLQAIDELGERERLILNLYYVEELSMREIAHVLDISIPRVSQIHGRTLMELRKILTPLLEDI